MNQNEETRVLLSFMHTLFCKKDHEVDCNFYAEIELADCWDLPDVKCWEFLTELVLQKMGLDERGLLNTLSKVHKILGDLYRLKEKEQLLVKAILLDADLRILILSDLQLNVTLEAPVGDASQTLEENFEDLPM